MSDNLKKQLRWILAIVGAIGGLLYWKFVGCTTGHCPIQQNWFLSLLWGGSLGYLIGDMFKKKQTSPTIENKDEANKE
ncbi:MAG: DUF6132 family protein [Bacteroidales bacterium]|nr:DUF6132 family protein [Bacteroidales bacterium]